MIKTFGCVLVKVPEYFQALMVNKWVHKRHGGTGLGLAITKRLVELLKGTITVDSRVDQGSTFSFEVPVILEAN